MTQHTEAVLDLFLSHANTCVNDRHFQFTAYHVIVHDYAYGPTDSVLGGILEHVGEDEFECLLVA